MTHGYTATGVWQAGNIPSNELRLQPAARPQLEAVAPEFETEANEAPEYWYGSQTLGTDLAALVWLGAALATKETEVAALAAGSYLLATPVVHASHGQWAHAAGSLGLRTIPALMGGIAHSGQDCRTRTDDAEGWCEFGRDLTTSLAVAVGVVAASALDASLLGWKPQTPMATFTPLVGATQRCVWLGIGGML